MNCMNNTNNRNMKTNDNIEELFEAAKRHEKDMQRQQHLSDLVDQWAAAETPAHKSRNRKHIWITIGVAAGILVMVSIGLRSLQPQAPSNSGEIVAKNNPSTTTEPKVITGEQSSDNDIPMTNTTPTSTNPASKTILLAETIPAEEPAPTEAFDTTAMPSVEEPLLVENESPETETTTVVAKEKKVYERTSNRLVSINAHSNTRSTTDRSEPPLMTYSGTGTSAIYNLGKINF